MIEIKDYDLKKKANIDVHKKQKNKKKKEL